MDGRKQRGKEGRKDEEKAGRRIERMMERKEPVPYAQYM